MKALLLSAVQEDRIIILKFYDPITNRVILWKDPLNYKPYCYVAPEFVPQIREFVGIENIEDIVKWDIRNDCNITMSKVTCKDNFVILKNIIPTVPTWESDMRIQNSYIYDNGFQVGKWYEVKKDYIEQLDNNSEIKLDEINVEGIIEKQKFLDNVKKWAKLLDEPIPDMRRLAFDIEVESGKDSMPDPNKAEQRVTAISFCSEDINEVFVLKRPEVPEGEDIRGTGIVENIEWFDSEKTMIEQAFDIIESYPICLTYNGDTFDMPYLFNRAVNLGIENIPLKLIKSNATLAMGVHLDLYTVFKNVSLKIYAFKSKYVENGLGHVSKALLGEGKLEYKGTLDQIPLNTLAHYCFNDARLTYKLSSYNNNLIMNLLVIISRISNMSIDECSRYAINKWIKSLLYYTHRINNELIPREFPKDEASTTAKTDKKYEGATVLVPQPGIHFNVKVMDFASLYPSIIKTKNVSYDTVNCRHDECKSNIVPFTKHHICTKKNGILAMLIGSLKELRVGHFKKLSKTATSEDEKSRYETISEALKVFLNASYGVIGYEEFPLYYLPTAEAITSYGRDIIGKTISHAKELGIDVLYGDTDSIFTKDPTQEQANNLIGFAKERFNIDLEQDKAYRYVVLSNRKKNYFGIKSDGKADIKGLSGKKSNTPPFIRELFTEIIDNLGKVTNIDEFTGTRSFIKSRIQDTIKGFNNIPMDKLVFKTMVKNTADAYKVKPNSLKAAEQISEHTHIGQFVEYIKTYGEPNVKPVQLVQRHEVNREKYLEILDTVMTQIIEPMDMDMQELLGYGHATKLSEFF